MSNDVLGVRRPERDMLRGFLDWYRAVVTNKLVGLSLEQASQVMTPTGLSPSGPSGSGSPRRHGICVVELGACWPAAAT